MEKPKDHSVNQAFSAHISLFGMGQFMKVTVSHSKNEHAYYKHFGPGNIRVHEK